METLTESHEKLPRTTIAFFQEYTFDRIDPAQHADLVIERILAYGNRYELRWLFRYYPRKKITEWVQRMGARRLPWRRYNLWCVILYLPSAQRLRSDDQRIWQH